MPVQNAPGIVRLRQTAAVACAFALLAGWSAPLRAQSPARWEGEVKAALMYFRYEEFNDDGGVLDRETGYLPGVTASLGRVSGPWAAYAEASVNVGTADYTGETTRTSSSIPVTTQTSELIFNAHARVERWSRRDAQWRAAGYAGLGYRGWNRDISSAWAGGLFVGGVTEYYDTGYWMLGAKAAAGPAVSHWVLDLRVQRTVRPRVHIASTPNSDAMTLPLGVRASPAGSFGWRSQRNSRTVLGVDLFFEQWEFGRSATVLETLNGVPTGFAVYEPDSRTRSYGLRASVTSAF